MATQILTFSPLDTLLLRDGRAFSPGDGTEAVGTFPPSPVTLQGLVRSKLLSDHCGRWATFANTCRLQDGSPCPEVARCAVRQVTGEYGEDGTLRLRGPWLRVNGVDVLPVPPDLVTAKRGRATPTVVTHLLAPDRGAAVRGSNLSGRLFPLSPPAELDEDFVTVDGHMSIDAVAQYLAGQPPSLQQGKNWWPSGTLWAHERRPGLAVNGATNTARDQFLYFAQHTRVGGIETTVDVVVAVEGARSVLSPGSFVAPLGGERRAAAVTVRDGAPPWRALPALPAGANRLKLVLQQPTWLKAGWCPDGWSADTGTARVAGHELQWVSALVGRGERLGGWDLAQRRPKPVRTLAPRGSIFYLEAANAAEAAVVAAHFIDGALVDNTADRPSLASMGFGQVLVGTW